MSVYLDVDGSETPICSSGIVRANLDVNGALVGLPIGIQTATVRVSLGIYWDGITPFNISLAEWEVLYPFRGVFSGVLITGLSYTRIFLVLQQDGSLFLSVNLSTNFQVAGPGTFPLDGAQHAVEATISFPDYLTISWVVGVDGVTVLSGSDPTLTGVLSHTSLNTGYSTDSNPDADPISQHAWIDAADAFWSHRTLSDLTAAYIESLTHVRVDDSSSLGLLAATVDTPLVTSSSCGGPGGGGGGTDRDKTLLSVPRKYYTPYQTVLKSPNIKRTDCGCGQGAWAR